MNNKKRKVKKTYIYDTVEKYVIVLEQQRTNAFYLLTAYHLNKEYGEKALLKKMKERYLPMPDYDKSTATEVVLTLPGTVIDENYSLLLLEDKNLSLTDAVLLDSVQKGKRISPEAVTMLRKRKLIEGVYHISS